MRFLNRAELKHMRKKRKKSFHAKHPPEWYRQQSLAYAAGSITPLAREISKENPDIPLSECQQMAARMSATVQKVKPVRQNNGSAAPISRSPKRFTSEQRICG